MHSIHSAPFLSIMIDETTDISNKEQVVVCLRWVDKALEAHEEFIGLHQVESTASTVLVGVIHDVLTRMNVSIHKIRGQCYDGASAMCGSQGGVYSHCNSVRRAQGNLYSLLWPCTKSSMR